MNIAPPLYHGTNSIAANSLLKDGWQGNSSSASGHGGQGRYLYLTTTPENALWYAQEAGDEMVLEVTDVPIEYLRVDPEDGWRDTVEKELGIGSKDPYHTGSVVLIRELPSQHFSIYKGGYEI